MEQGGVVHGAAPPDIHEQRPRTTAGEGLLVEQAGGGGIQWQSVNDGMGARQQLPQPPRQLSLHIALVLVRIPSADIRERCLNSKICFKKLSDLLQAVAKLAAGIFSVIFAVQTSPVLHHSANGSPPAALVNSRMASRESARAKLGRTCA